MAVDDLESLEETLSILGDPAAMRAIREAETQPAEPVDPAQLRHEIAEARGWTSA